MTATECAPPGDLQRLLDGALPGPDAAAVRAHLPTCPACQATLDRLADCPELRRWKAAPPRPADERVTALLTRLCETPPVGTLAPAAGGASPPFLGPPAVEGDLGSLGPYRVLCELGRGGMGVVFKAFDPALGRAVALKVLRPERADLASRARFVREARAAAALDHPHVVPVHAVANPADGPPYLVMPYVGGPTLRARITAEKRLAPQEAARLVAEVADGLAAAHALGQVHRDVKPANVLLDEATGRARLTDFGLVRLAERGGTTLEGPFAGTPEYMSPEQISAPDRLDARTDVYALGVTLYEALTGEVPFRGAGHMVLQQVLHDDPPSPRQLNDAVPRDLETVCLKALAKEPARRYAGAAELRDDLTRFLDGQPVRARPPGRVGRVWRWCRRHRAPAALSAALLLTIVAGFAGVVWQWRRAEAKAAEARDRAAEADASFRQARAAVDTFFKDFYQKGVLNRPGLEAEKRRLVEEMIRAYRGFAELRRDDPAFQAEVAEIYFRIGVMTMVAGSKPDALAALEEGIGRYERLAREAPDDDRYGAGLAGCHAYAGQVLIWLGRAPEAVPHLEASHDYYARDYRAHPDDTNKRHQLANSCGNLGLLYCNTGRGDARRVYLEALPIHEALAREAPDDVVAQVDLGKTYFNLGYVGATPAEALAWYEKSRVLRERLFQAGPGPLRAHELAGSLRAIGGIHAREGRRDECLRALRQACDLLREAVAREPTTVAFQGRLVACLIDLAEQHRPAGEWVEELRLLTEARAVVEGLMRANPEQFRGDRDEIDKGIADARRALARQLGSIGPLP
jgi:tetratricopeptide (TPR) repeat protein